MGRASAVFAVGLASVLGGCYHGVDSTADIVSSRDVEFNNTQLQGVQLQGVQLQGTAFSGTQVINGELVTRSGEELIGAELSLAIEADGSNETFVLRFDNIYPDPKWDDVSLYEISYRPIGSDAWTDLCAGGVPAIPLSNYWDHASGDRIDDPNVATFACTNAVLAKCVEWGYRPWAEATRCKDWDSKKKKKGCTEVSLQDYHQACTRMARADYCGDGTPWTVPGTAIDIYDHLNPQIEAMATDWTIEAEWTPEGAYCLNDIRQQAWKQQGLYPACFLNKYGKPKKYGDCGSLKHHRALLANGFDKFGEGP